MTVDNHDYPSVTMDLHPATRALVFDFANALGGKLSAAEKKYGRSDDWAHQDWEAECRAKLMQHIDKGDPLDVAAYCAFMWSRGWRTSENESDRFEKWWAKFQVSVEHSLITKNAANAAWHAAASFHGSNV